MTVGVIPRISAVALSLALLAGNLAVCAAWTATPDARMACCTDEDTCPMHRGESHQSGEKRALSQAQADACCAASEEQPSHPSSPSLVTVISSAVLDGSVVIPAPVPAPVVRDAWRALAPAPVTPVHRHVLLSVFLV